ncbi:MAG: 6-phosphogluconolactonase [Gemmobacter sp.]
MTLEEYPERDLMFLALADRLAGGLSDFLRREGRASFAVPGGTTPGPVFDTLSGVDIDWPAVTVMLGDERWVPEGDPRSNAALVRARLLRGKAAGAAFLPFWRDGMTPEAAAPILAEAVAPHLPLSVALLGMGEDGHVASLFPGGDRLAEALAAGAPAVLPMRAPGAGEPRMTLTAPVLAGAMHIHILITGRAKRAALDRVRGLPAAEAPVRAVLDHATVHWAE